MHSYNCMSGCGNIIMIMILLMKLAMSNIIVDIES